MNIVRMTSTVHLLNPVKPLSVTVVLLPILGLATLTLSLARAPFRLVDEPEKIGMVALEVWVVVFAGTLVLPLARLHRIVRQSDPLVKAIHVQLSDE